MMYALIRRDLTDTGKRRENVEAVPRNKLHILKPYWVPVVVETIDTSTGEDSVTSAWVKTIEDDRILLSRTTRDKTKAERNDEDTTLVDTLTRIDRAHFLIAFNQEKRIRALEGASAINKKQFKTAYKALLR